MMSAELGETVREDAAAMLPDPDGPDGNKGVVTCVLCQSPGWLMDADDRGFRILHSGRAFACRPAR
jgi:hypothetical protein